MSKETYPCPKCQTGTLRKAGKHHDGRQRWACMRREAGRKIRCYETLHPDQPPRRTGGEPARADKRPQFKRKLEGKRYVITWAQNGTPPHEGFFAALQAYCKRNGAELVVIPGRYKNPTSQWTQAQQNAENWHESLQPYLFNRRKKLNRNLTLLGDIKSQPTAKSPLSGFEGLTHSESSIIGHPRLQLVSVPTPGSLMPKIMTTTGAVTVPNYTDSRAGKEGAFHHVLGATLVEIQGEKIFHLRQINATKTGAFIDLRKAYYPDGTVEDCGPYLGLVLGDSHWRFRDKTVEKATFGRGGLTELLDPEYLVFHDLLDAYAVNPHHVGDPFLAVAKHGAGFNDIRDEVEQTVKWVAKVSQDREGVVVPSNHDDMLKRWLMREDWRRDPMNADFYLETALQLVRAARMTERGAQTHDPFGYWLDQAGHEHIRALHQNESFQIAGIECGLHGHEGPSGARGTVKNLSKIGVKAISGHGHGPAIEGGHYRVGTSTPLSLEYTGPIGNWLNTHCSIDPFGKRHLHNVINGKFKL